MRAANTKNRRNCAKLITFTMLRRGRGGRTFTKCIYQISSYWFNVQGKCGQKCAFLGSNRGILSIFSLLIDLRGLFLSVMYYFWLPNDWFLKIINFWYFSPSAPPILNMDTYEFWLKVIPNQKYWIYRQSKSAAQIWPILAGI